MRSVEDSLQRLGMDRIDVLLIHDVDVWTHGSEAARLERFQEVMDGGYHAMLKLREEGVVRAIGAGINEIQACEEFARAGDFDCFLLAGRYTLLEQDGAGHAAALLRRADISLLIGGPYNTGILATGAVPGAYYNYAPAPAEIMERVAGIEAVCNRHGVRLASAALQFPLGHPQRRDPDPRRPLAGGDRAEPGHLRGRHPGGALGGAQGRRPAARGRPHALMSARVRCRPPAGRG